MQQSGVTRLWEVARFKSCEVRLLPRKLIKPLCVRVCVTVHVQLYDKGGKQNETRARAELIDIVSDAGNLGFETLVRALVRNEQECLAKQLDEELAEENIKNTSAVSGILSPLLSLHFFITG